MADHTPRLCIECGKPLSAAEKRLKYPFLCPIHRKIREMRQALLGDGFWT